jgi:hypothetical protein
MRPCFISFPFSLVSAKIYEEKLGLLPAEGLGGFAAILLLLEIVLGAYKLAL